MATPVVSLAVETPVTDENFFRNGNFYSSFWTTPAGVSCPVNVETQNANYWTVNPHGAAVTCKRSTDVPDLYSLWSLEIDGAVGVTDCSVGQQINGDLSATLRRPCTWSGYIENNSGALLSPTLEIWTANAFNNFNTVTLQTTVNLQSVANASWVYCTVTIDLSAGTIANVANGLLIKVRIPNGALAQPTYRINFSRIKFQLGEVATQFVDDPSLFIQAPSVDSTMLQDGCIARPSLFLPNVIPQGAFQAGAIQSGDIGAGQVKASNLAGVSTTLSAGFTQPAVSGTVSIVVASTTSFVAAQSITIAVGGAYTVSSVTDSTHMVVTNTGAVGNAAPAANVPTGGAVTLPSAVIGSLGYTPVNKAGDVMTGGLTIKTTGAVQSSAGGNASFFLSTDTGGNVSHDAVLLYKAPSGDQYARIGYYNTSGTLAWTGSVLDSHHGVDTNSYQPGSITLAALSQSLINILIPPGTVRMFAGPNIPAGWLVCDGHQVSRTTYAALFAALGTYWGAGDAITTFNLPDFRGRSPLGYVSSAIGGITSRAFASIGGEEAHTLGVNELANHNHQLVDGQHNHGVSQNPHSHSYVNPLGTAIGYQGGPSTLYAPAGLTQTSSDSASLGTYPANANISINPAGGNTAHNNMSPFAVLYFVIKT